MIKTLVSNLDIWTIITKFVSRERTREITRFFDDERYACAYGRKNCNIAMRLLASRFYFFTSTYTINILTVPNRKHVLRILLLESHYTVTIFITVRA